MDDFIDIELHAGDYKPPHVNIYMKEDGEWVVEIRARRLACIEIANSMMSRSDAIQKAIETLDGFQSQLSATMFESD
jgi:hypothetical protein